MQQSLAVKEVYHLDLSRNAKDPEYFITTFYNSTYHTSSSMSMYLQILFKYVLLTKSSLRDVMRKLISQTLKQTYSWLEVKQKQAHFFIKQEYNEQEKIQQGQVL